MVVGATSGIDRGRIAARCRVALGASRPRHRQHRGDTPAGWWHISAFNEPEQYCPTGVARLGESLCLRWQLIPCLHGAPRVGAEPGNHSPFLCESAISTPDGACSRLPLAGRQSLGARRITLTRRLKMAM